MRLNLFASFLSPMALNSADECQCVHSSVVVLPDRGDAYTEEKMETPSSFTSLEVCKLMKSQVSLISEPKVEVGDDKSNSYAILDVDVEKGKTENPKFNEESFSRLKLDDFLTRALLREVCLKIGGKFMQLLMNHEAELPKFTSRDRSRKYKRSASFNSRRVVLLFSILSIIGTIILIYLTLRARHISDEE